MCSYVSHTFSSFVTPRSLKYNISSHCTCRCWWMTLKSTCLEWAQSRLAESTDIWTVHLGTYTAITFTICWIVCICNCFYKPHIQYAFARTAYCVNKALKLPNWVCWSFICKILLITWACCTSNSRQRSARDPVLKKYLLSLQEMFPLYVAMMEKFHVGAVWYSFVATHKHTGGFHPNTRALVISLLSLLL